MVLLVALVVLVVIVVRHANMMLKAPMTVEQQTNPTIADAEPHLDRSRCFSRGIACSHPVTISAPSLCRPLSPKLSNMRRQRKAGNTVKKWHVGNSVGLTTSCVDGSPQVSAQWLHRSFSSSLFPHIFSKRKHFEPNSSCLQRSLKFMLLRRYR